MSDCCLRNLYFTKYEAVLPINITLSLVSTLLHNVKQPVIIPIVKSFQNPTFRFLKVEIMLITTTYYTELHVDFLTYHLGRVIWKKQIQIG